eukprot:Gb_04906 [translate_table: standard]
MGSAGNPNQPGGFDVQKFFKPGSPANPNPAVFNVPPSAPYPPPYQPGSSATSTHPTSSYPNIHASFSFPLHTPPLYHHPYMPYPQDHHQNPPPRPMPYPSPPPYANNNTLQQQPGFTQTAQPQPSIPPPPRSPSPQLHLPSPIASPPLDGARLMALLTAHSSGENHLPSHLELPPPALSSSESYLGSQQVASMPPPALAPAIPTAPPVSLAPPPPPSRLPSSKLPRGRHLHGERVVYDVDLRLAGETQPQLEVSPITNYVSDPVLVVGRQIAVNRNYICYGLRAGTIRILNINTALRALLRGHSQRVTDMAFFSEDVHLLASASSDGRVFIRKIVEGLGEDDKMQITEQIVLAIHIVGDWDSVHPRVCWHSHQQDILVVGVGRYVLKIDVAKARSAARGIGLSSEDPVKCHVDSPLEGVSCMGKHEGEVTDLSISQWITTRLASASKDGMVQIWGDKKMLPLATLKPHDGQPVGSVAFLTVPRRSDHMVLLTAGPLNRELKLWVSASSDGWLTPSESEKWKCIQTLDLRSSSEPRNELAFFNQVLVLPRASLILLANAKKNAIYAVHIEFGSNPAATRMDYLAEFSVTMPILSLTATSENVADGEGTVQVYCVQTQAIQQYALDLSQCLPSPIELVTSEKDTTARIFEISASSAFSPVEPSHGNNIGEATTGNSRAKSPGPVNIAEKASTSRSPVFMSTMEPSSTHDPLVMSGVEAKYGVPVPTGILTENAPLSSQVPVPLSPRLSQRQSRSKSPSRNFEQGFTSASSDGDQEYSVERKVDTVLTTLPDVAPVEAVATTRKVDEVLKKDEERLGQRNISAAMSPSISIDCQVSSSPTHLITPSQLMSMAVPPPENAPATNDQNRGDNKPDERGVNTETENMKLETKDAGGTSLNQLEESSSQKEAESASLVTDTKEQMFSSHASEHSSDNTRESSSLSTEGLAVEENQPGEDGEVLEERDQSSNICIDEVQENSKDVTGKVSESALLHATSQSPSVGKGKKNKIKIGSASAPSSTSVSPFTSVGSSDLEPSSTTSIPPIETVSAQVLAMQEALNQLITMQKELQKQMTVMVSVPVAKEGKRMEAALGQRMEKVVKAHVDAMWARIQEENAKREKSERERVQQLTALLSNSINKDLPATLERVLKKEIASLGPAVARLVTPSLEKSISTAINDAFQKGISDKALAQLEKSVGTKLDSVVSRQIQTQFQSSGKQALQDALRSSFEGSVIPAFERSCRAMFEQVDSAFQKGMAEHTTAAQQQFAASHTALASTLQEAVISASSLAQSLKGELADGHRKLLALAESAGAGPSRLPGFNTKPSNGGLGGLPDKAISLKHLEESLDPTKELSRLLSERKFEEAFHKALQMSDVSIVSWLCSQADPQSLFSTVPLPLSQGVLLSLVQQLGCDLGKDTARKLVWIREAALALNPNDPILAPHMRPILEQLYQNLHRQMLLVNSGGEASSVRLVLHVVNSILTACK